MGTCRKCGAATSLQVTVTRGPHDAELGEQSVVNVFNTLCRPCFDRAAAQAEAMREEFDVLIASGWDREAANEFMIEKYRLDLPRGDG